MNAHEHAGSTAIRAATDADLTRLVKLVGESTEGMPLGTPPSERPRMLRQVISDPHFEVFVAGLDAALGGCVVIRYIGEPHDAGAAGMISDLFVAAEYRRRDIGTSLLSFAIDTCRQRGYPEVRLWVNNDNAAIRLYERCGFQRQRVEMRLEL